LTNSILKFALQAIKAGIYVFPLQPDGKAPATPSGYHDASIDEAQILKWFGADDCKANIGIALAKSGYVVLDIDIKEGVQAAERLNQLEAEIGKLPETLTAQTPSGGLHLYFKSDDDLCKVRKIAFRLGLDFLGDGYVLSPPSSINGKVYRWARKKPAVALPETLSKVALAGKIRESVSPVESADDLPKIESGSRNNEMFRVACSLRNQGLPERAVHASLVVVNQERLKEPLDDAEIRQIVSSAMNRAVIEYDLVSNASIKGLLDELKIKPATDNGYLGKSIAQLAKTDFPKSEMYKTGFDHLDEFLGGGFPSGGLSVVCGAPASGKSSLVQQFILSFVKQRPVLLISTELGDKELICRYDAVVTNRTWRELMLDEKLRDRSLKGPCRYLSTESIVRDYEGFKTQTVAIMEDMKKELGVYPIVGLDYMQNLARGSDDARGAIASVSLDFLRMSRFYNTLVLAVSSVSRNYYGSAKQDAMRRSPDPSVYLASSKESGDTEFDAGVVLYLETLFDIKKQEDGTLFRPGRLAVAKARQGTTGFVGAGFVGATGKWFQHEESLTEFAEDGPVQKRKPSPAEKDLKEYQDLAIKHVQQRSASKQPPFTRDVLRTTINPGRKDHLAGDAINILIQEGFLEIPTAPYVNGNNTKILKPVMIGRKQWR
jgi:KaiC/GvpD/RAD55 family RecA-like ATPase